MKPVPGLVGYYATKCGNIYSDYRKKGMLTNSYHCKGYVTARLHGKTYTVHSLVAMSYIGHRPKGLVINHKDANKKNNRPENLEYITQAENIKHAQNLGLMKGAGKGTRRGASPFYYWYDKSKDAWRATLNVEGKSIYLKNQKSKKLILEEITIVRLEWFGETKE